MAAQIQSINPQTNQTKPNQTKSMLRLGAILWLLYWIYGAWMMTTAWYCNCLVFAPRDEG